MPSLLSPGSFTRELAVLEKAGLGDGRATKPKIEEQFLEIMEVCGLDKTAVMCKLADLMESGEMESTKIAAIRLALSLYMHPAFVQKDKVNTGEHPTVIFNFSDSNVNLNQMLTPVVRPAEDYQKG